MMRRFSRTNGRLSFLRNLNPRMARSVLSYLVLALIVVATIVVVFLSLTLKSAGMIDTVIPKLASGDISPNREIALFDFQVPKSPEQLEADSRQAVLDVLPVFTLDRAVVREVDADVDSLFKVLGRLDTLADTAVLEQLASLLPPDITFDEARRLKTVLDDADIRLDRTEKTLKAVFEDLYKGLIVTRRADLAYLADQSVAVEDVEGQRTVAVETIVGVDSARTTLDSLFAKHAVNMPSSVRRTMRTIALELLRPNLHYNASRTQERHEQALLSVNPYAASYKRNELIIEANVPVTEAHVAALEAYRAELNSRVFKDNRRKHFTLALGQIVLALGIVGLFVGYIHLYRKRIYQSFSYLVLLALIAALPLSVAWYAAWNESVSEYLIPVAMATILATILFDAEIGMMLGIAVSLVTALMLPGSGFNVAILYTLAGAAGVMTVGRVRHRREFYRSMTIVPLAMIAIVAATHDWVGDTSYSELGSSMFLAAINGFFCPILAIGLLPLLESTFRIATDITLLELSDLNNPLLKEMAVRASGTFSSVLMVGALAEAAAERIGANPLLARVGAYYHDIGKMVIPEYFIENQMGGDNPHDRLSPHMSSLVIASHVKEGYELGVQFGLPQAILDIIQQHHGTSLMASIYHKAIENAPVETQVEDSSFRYSGPKPQTREAGIVMLADLVEAASRAVKEKSPGRLNTLVSTIIRRRFLEGELDECDLTLRDLHNIEESFVPVLIGSWHGRIEYPWQKAGSEAPPRITGGGMAEQKNGGRESEKADQLPVAERRPR